MSERSRAFSDRSHRVAARMRNVIGSVQLDCECSKRLNDALDRFLEQEKVRDDRRHLIEARQHRTAIAAMLDLLRELEEISSLRDGSQRLCSMRKCPKNIWVDLDLTRVEQRWIRLPSGSLPVLWCAPPISLIVALNRRLSLLP
jgi:hypothetical protein